MASLPILMYHDVCEVATKGIGLTISVDKLEQQFRFLSENGYTSHHFSDLINFQEKKKLPKKSVVITFDDVYISHFKLVYPLLKQYHLKASFFIPFAYVGGLDAWNTNAHSIMSVDDLKSLDPSIVELGLHSYQHKKYNEMPIEAIDKDFELCENFISQHNLNVQKVLAYPYGKYPRKGIEKQSFFNCLQSHNIAYGLRIGNRVNRFPFKNNYEIQRIDIKGEDSITRFKIKLHFGKLLLF